MKLGKQAALGLSALMLGGLALPFADAASSAPHDRLVAGRQIGRMIDNPLISMLGLHEAAWRLPRAAASVPASTKTLPIAPIARTVPVHPQRVKAVSVRQVRQVASRSHSVKTARRTIRKISRVPAPGVAFAGRLEPVVRINPAIRTAAETLNPTYNQAENPVFKPIYQTFNPDEKLSHQAEEAFNMMAAASPLEQLALQTRTASHRVYAPGMSIPPAGFSNGVKVLKSGISQQVASVDLAVGKAEVVRLSRPASRVSVSNPDVASAVIISPTQIQLVGKSVGVANLLVWGDMVSPDHTVVDVSVHRDVSVLVNQLKYVDPGIRIVPMAAEDTVILSGQAETRESAQLAIDMAKAFFSKSAAGMPGNSGNGPNSQSPGSAMPGVTANVINLIKIKGEPSTKADLVRSKLSDIDPNIRMDVVPGPEGNEKVILTGRVPSASVASKALNLASVFYGQPGIKLITAQGGNEPVRLQTSATSSSSGSSGGSSSSSSSGSGNGPANMLRGSVMTDATGNVISMLEIAQKPQVRCSIKFLELNKNSLNALGHSISGVRGPTKFMSWSGVHSSAPGKPISVPSSQNAPGSGWTSGASRDAAGNGWVANNQNFLTNWNEVFQSGVTQVFTINNQIVAALQALQERRQIRTLAEPTITMLSGEQGSFLAGGEIPIAFLGGNGQISIEFHEYGIRLNILPTVTDDNKIQMQVSPEVSAVDTSVSIQGVPGFTTRRMNTNLLVEPGQSFVLAGLYNQADTDSVSRLPGVGSLPVLGSFFRNKWKNGTKTEMVVLIRPEIMYSQTGETTPHAATAPLPEEGRLSRK